MIKQGLMAAATLGLLCLVSGTAVSAATDTARTVPWNGPAGRFSEPKDATTGAPAYVAFDNVLSPVGSTSSSQVLDNAGGNHVGVEVTSGANQSGSIWSNDAIPLTKDFDAKMQLNFGKTDHPADGMTFALTGTRPTQVYQDGSSLGIWKTYTAPAVFWDDPKVTPGLPNSFAVVFDTYHNGDSQDANIPKGDPGQYIGWGYPGQDAQYGDEYDGYPLKWAQNGGLGGYQSLKRSLTDGQWHQLEINWQATGDGGGTLHFKFYTGATVIIDRSVTFTAAQTKQTFGGTTVYWGFTGSTGANQEDGVVAFQSIPGLVNNKLSVATDAAKVTLGQKLHQVYTLTYDPQTSKQSWPLTSSDTKRGTLSATLTTGSHYGFVVADDGKVHVTLKDGTMLTGTPVGSQTTAQDATGHPVSVTASIQVTGLPGFIRSGAEQTLEIQAPLLAISVGASEQAPAGVVIGNNAEATADANFPAVVALPKPAITAVPKFNFGAFDVATVIHGIKNRAAVPTTPDSALKVVLPGNEPYTLSAKLDSFDLGPQYHPGNSQVVFQYNGHPYTLKDDDTETPLFSGQSTAPNSSVTGANLTVNPFPQAQVGTYHAAITWTLAATPTSNDIQKN